MQNEPGPSTPNVITPTPIDPVMSPQPVMPPPEPPRRGKRKLIGIVVAVVLVLLLATSYVLAFYLPNQPGGVYKDGLTNTGKAVDRLVSYTKQQQTADYKAAEFDGEIHVKSPVVSFDLTASGVADENGNADMKLDTNIMGEKLQGNIRSIKAKGSGTPDLYLKVSNAEKLLGQFGMQKYNDKWVMVDHTLLDTYARKAGAENNGAKMPDNAQLADALVKLQEVNKTYLFTTDESKAVLKQEKFIGKETIRDREAYHYKVGYNKAHLKTYVTEAKKALDSSKLNDWAKTTGGKNISEQSGFDTLEEQVEKAKGDYQFELWIDTTTRVVSQLQFADPKNADSTFTIAQHYPGSGSTYPFSFSFKGKNSNDEPYSGTFDFTLDTKTHKVSMVMTGKSEHEGGKKDEISGNFTVTPSNKPVDVTTPSGATSVNQVMQELLAAQWTALARL